MPLSNPFRFRFFSFHPTLFCPPTPHSYTLSITNTLLINHSHLQPFQRQSLAFARNRASLPLFTSRYPSTQPSVFIQQSHASNAATILLQPASTHLHPLNHLPSHHAFITILSNRNNPLFNPATPPFHHPSSSHPLYNSTHTNTPTPQLPTLHPFSTFHPIHITFSSSIQPSASHTTTQSLHSLFTSSQSLSYTPSIYSSSKQSNAPTSHPFQIPL